MPRVNFGEGTPKVRLFSDPLNNTATFLKNWVQGMTWYTPVQSVFASQTCAIGAASDTFNALLWSYFGQNNPNQVINSWAVPLLASNFRGRNQFVQVTRVDVSANGATIVIDGGIGVLLNTNPQSSTFGNGMVGYGLYILTNAATGYQLRRFNGGNSETDLAASSFSSVNGDVIRLEATINSPTSVTLKAFKNGTLQFTTVDDPSAFFDPTVDGGVPFMVGAIHSGLAGTTGSPRQQYRTFSCGLI